MTEPMDEFDVFEDFATEEVETGEPLEEAPYERMLFTPTQLAAMEAKLSSGEDAFSCGTERRNLHNCVLETIVRPGLDPAAFRLDIDEECAQPAKQYKFALDPFQKAAIKSIERGQSVLVAAHTSAGKTAVAEYVIAECLRRNQRVIYTSPIKALSNQKYRELREEFGKVGLVTGDITIDEHQTCLVMTTEILRNMLFRSNEVAKETAWIIFDEVHYLKDRERGVIWEETIILAPKNVRYCLLSATTPNATDLATWILKVKELDCINVVYTDYRPTPLEYWAFAPGQTRILLVRSAAGEVVAKNLAQLGAPQQIEGEPAQRPRRTNSKLQDVKQIVKLIHNRGFYPAIIFVFSKKDVELIGKKLATELRIAEARDAAVIESFYEAAVGGLSAEDRQLPQVLSLLPILKSGVGLHHGGMLPLLKEIVEILFQLNVLKILVSTETFSMGVNMPAKCVVFSSVQKWDGERFRLLTGSEFVQMSGRAGRRGRDAKGHVICMLDDNTDQKEFGALLRTGSSLDPLISQFSVNYNMVLNSLILEGFAPEQMLRQSFKQFGFDQQQKRRLALLVGWRARLATLRPMLLADGGDKLHRLLAVLRARRAVRRARAAVRAVLVEPRVLLPFLAVGRLLLLDGCGWAVFRHAAAGGREQRRVLVDALVFADHGRDHALVKRDDCLCRECCERAGATLLKEPKVLTVELSRVSRASAVIVPPPANIVEEEQRVQLRETVFRVLRQFAHSPPLLELLRDVPVAEPRLLARAETVVAGAEAAATALAATEQSYIDFVAQKPFVEGEWNWFVFEGQSQLAKRVAEELETSELYFRPTLIDSLFVPRFLPRAAAARGAPYIAERELRGLGLFRKFSKRLRHAFEARGETTTLVEQQTIRTMKRVLQRLEFIDGDEVPLLKGRVAALIFGADELLLTEMLFSGYFSELAARPAAVLLSVFVNEERPPKTRPRVRDALVEQLLEKARATLQYLCRVCREAEVAGVDEEARLEALQPTLFEVIDKWATGATFADVMKNTDLYEGSAIRAIKRLYELLRQMRECALVFGNKELESKFAESAEKLYRGIVFAGSLYLVKD